MSKRRTADCVAVLKIGIVLFLTVAIFRGMANGDWVIAVGLLAVLAANIAADRLEDRYWPRGDS